MPKTKWSILKQKNQWNTPSQQEEKILALEAKVKKLESQRSSKKDIQSGKGGASTSTLSGQNQQGDRAPSSRYEAWMFDPPKDGESQPKLVGTKPFWWCTKHKKWCRHTTDGCRGLNIGKGAPKSSNESSQASTSSNSKSNKKKQRIVRALGAAAQDDDEETVYSEDEE